MYFVSIKKYLKRVVLCLLAANPCIELLYADSSVDEEVRQQQADQGKQANEIKEVRKKRRKEMYNKVDGEEDEVEEESENTTSQSRQKLHNSIDAVLDAKDEATRKQLLAALHALKEAASPEDYQRHKKAIQKIIKENRKLSSTLKEDMQDVTSFQAPQNEDSSVADEHYFIPIEPKKLTAEEKKQSTRERISKRHIGEIPEKIDNIIFYINTREQRKKNNTPIHNRILLFGKPGTGKTDLCKVVADELGAGFIYMPAPVLKDKYQGETQRRVNRVFDNAETYVRKHNKPVIIFIDEIDAIAPKRTDSMHIEDRNTVTRLLTSIQNMEGNRDIFVIVATNDLEILDPALIDRFGKSKCEIKQLNTQQRAKLFQKIFRDFGKEIDDQRAIILSDKIAGELNLGGKCSNRDIRDMIETGLLNKEKDCEQNPERCKYNEFYYVMQEIKKHQSLRTTAVEWAVLLIPGIWFEAAGECLFGAPKGEAPYTTYIVGTKKYETN